MTGPLAWPYLASVMLVDKVQSSSAFPVKCSPVKVRWQRVKIGLPFNIDIQYYIVGVTILSMFLSPFLTVTTIWNTGETGDIYAYQ